MRSAASFAAVFALLCSLSGCVEGRPIPLAPLSPNAAALLIVSRPARAPWIYAFESDGSGRADLPPLTLTRDDDVRLIEFGCSLAALQLSPGPQESGARPIPQASAAYRLNADRFEPLTFVASEYTGIRLPGEDPNACLKFERYVEHALIGPDATPPEVMEPLDEDRLLVHLNGYQNNVPKPATYLVDRTGAQQISTLPDGTAAVFVHDPSTLEVTVVSIYGVIYRGRIGETLPVIATFDNTNNNYATVSRVPSSTTTFFFATDAPAVFRVTGDRVETLFQEPCDRDQLSCEGHGVVATSTNNAYAVLSGSDRLFHLDNGNMVLESLDSGGINQPRAVALDPRLGPLIGSQIGGVFAFRNGRWEVLTVLFTRDIDFIQWIPGGFLMNQLSSRVTEYNFELGKNCESVDITSQVHRSQMMGDELAFAVRREDGLIAIRFYELPRDLNRCPAP